MKNSNLLATFTLLASLTGCSLIKVQGLGGNKTSAQNPGGSSAAASDAPPPPGKTIKGAPADDGAYKVISYERFTNTTDLDGDYAFRVVGGSATHPEKGGNPDPTWILRWELPMTQDDAKTMIAQAAINRTWLARADKDFVTWWANIVPLATAQAAAIATIEAGAANHYERMLALRALWAETNKAATALDLANNAMLQFQVVNSVAKSNAAASVGFATQRFRIWIKAQNEFGNQAHALQPKEKERQLFLLAAANGDLAITVGTPKLPVTAQNAKTRSAIKWPIDAALEKQLRAEVERNQATVAAWIIEPPKTVSPDDTKSTGLIFHDGQGLGDNVADGTTDTKVTAIGSGQVTLTSYLKRSVPFNCKTGIVTGLDGSRTVGQNCSYKSDDTKNIFILKTNELPVKIQIGDVLTFYGTRTARQEKNKTITSELDALYITKVIRKGTVLFTE